ncbi:MAG: VWA domain-containing protein [Crocinitomicaceae bacterium]|nr:VWA domain-containing protein [Crocinitomicaceae bacterium]MDG1776566.1 VWA domain-containing protein [Crocinitomicaceae bacterium]
MSNIRYTYRIKSILSWIILWEIVFWGIYFGVVSLFASSGKLSEDNGLIYKSPESLYLLIGIIPIIGTYIYRIFKHNNTVKHIHIRVMKSVLQPVSSFSSFIRYIFFRNAFALLIIAVSLPIFGTKKVSGTSETLELVVALDISNSMNTHDISKKISRLEIAKRALVQLVNNLHGEKIGLCLFAHNAFVQLPITRDYSAAKLFIKEIESGMISHQGTNIDQALIVSNSMFSKEKTTKGIILVTDGENHEESPDQILSEIKNSTIQLSVLGIGTVHGGLIPKHPYRPELGYKTDATGKSVLSKLNKPFLQGIAKKGGGKASVSSSEFPNLSALLTQINQMKRTKIDTLEFETKQERYQFPLLLSLVFWIAYITWSKRYLGLLDNLVKKK